MKITTQIKSCISLLLCLVLMCGFLPVDTLAVTAEPIIVIAGSDYQNTNGGAFSSGKATSTYAIMSRIKEDYASAYGFLFGGDYYAHDVNTTTYSTKGKQQLQEEIVEALYPDMAEENQIYIQGNHDADSLTTNGTLATSGAHDTDYYGVYVINEKDYMWYNDSRSTIQNTAAALEAYMNAKQDEGYDKPIFVLSHLPLHFSKRTQDQGDGKYAKYIYDVLDEAGSNGLNIIFMYGHNHSTSYYEAYLGNGAVYLAEGSTIAIANEGSTSSYYTDSLDFTYMNYGFTGYLSNSAADGALTMTVFEITDGQVAVKRYDEDGLHNLKSAGTSSNMPSGLSPDTTVIGTGGATITLTTPASKATISDNGVTVTAVGITSVIAEKEEAPTYNAALYAGYEVYKVEAAGFETGKAAVVTFALDDGDFDTTRTVTVECPDGTTENVPVENGSITLETNGLGTFILHQTKTTGAVAPDVEDNNGKGTVWRQVDTFKEGKSYILVNYGENASGVGTYAIGSSAAPTAVDVLSDSEGAYIENADLSIAWTATANNSQYYLNNASTGDYLYATTSGSTSGVSLTVGQTAGTYSNWSMESNSNTDSALSVRRATSSNYYPVRYSNGGTEFLAYTSTQTSKYDNWVVIFEQTAEGGSTETVTPELGDDWVSLPSGGTYVLDTDGVDTGVNNKYIIVGSGEDYALTVSGGTVGRSAVTISNNTITVDDPSVFEFYFKDNSGAENGSYLLTQDGNETVYHANGNMYYGSDNKGYWHIGSNSNGAYQIYDYDNLNWYLNYGYVWASESVSRFAVSSNSRTVRLYKCVSSVSEDTFLRLAGETEQAYAASADLTEDAVLAKVYIEETTDGYYLSDTISVSSDMVIWENTFDGKTAGTYVGTVSYEGQNLGTVTVTITAEHNFETITAEPTCTADGSITTRCTICGEETVEVLAATGHTNEKVIVEPTCTEDGSVTTTCTVCGEQTVEVISATGHDYACTETAATCGQPGSRVYTCSVCADTYTEEIPATENHTYESISVDATCTEAGSVTHTCTVCGHTYAEAIAALGHSYETTVIAATCTENGYTVYTCATCGDSYNGDEVAAFGHTYDSSISATCTEAGFVVYTCETCGHSYNGEAVAAYGHSYESTTVAPGCATTGYTTYICTACGHTYTGDEIAALGHDYESAVTEATCTEAGFTTYTCGTCGHSYVGDNVEALGHDYESVVTEPTFETEGYTTHTCTVCGDVKVDSYVPVLSHTYETVTTDATCTEDGSVVHTCVDCGYSYTEVLPALGHSNEIHTTDATCTGNGSVVTTCTRCGHSETEVIPATGHDYETITIDPTCTGAGYTTYTCACGDVYTKEIAATGHSYQSSYTAPTCTENGGTTYTCACGDVYTEVIAATGHSYETDSVAPTCTEGGYTTYTCASCGDSYTGEETAALGHSYEGTVTAPTCTEGGCTTFVCTVCGDSYTGEETAALGHSYEGSVTAPTCTEEGYTAFCCTVCGHSYVGDETAALGHSYTGVESDSYMIYTCEVCGHSYSEKFDLSYTKVSSIDDDNNYVITLYSGRKYYALSHEDNELSVVQVTVSNNEITSEITEDLVWHFEDDKLSYEDGDDVYYLYAQSASGWWGWWSTPTLTLSTSNSSSVSFSSSKLKVGSYYLRYSNSKVSLNRSATTTYFFVEE